MAEKKTTKRGKPAVPKAGVTKNRARRYGDGGKLYCGGGKLKCK